MYWVYLLEDSKDGSWYTGYTTDLRRRLSEHQSGKGGQTTRLRNNWKLIYCEGYIHKDDAQGREIFLKSGSGRKFLEKQLQHYLK